MKDAYKQAHDPGMGRGNGHCFREDQQTAGKKRYVAPELKHQAHLRDITMGTSEGFGESIGTSSYKALPGFTDSSDKKSNKSTGIFDDDIFVD